MYSYELGYIITPLKDFRHHIKFVTTDLLQRGFFAPKYNAYRSFRIKLYYIQTY